MRCAGARNGVNGDIMQRQTKQKTGTASGKCPVCENLEERVFRLEGKVAGLEGVAQMRVERILKANTGFTADREDRATWETTSPTP